MADSIFNYIPLFVLKALGMTLPEEERVLEKQAEGKEGVRGLLRSLGDPDDYAGRRQLLEGIRVEEELARLMNRRRKSVVRLKRFYRRAAVVVLLAGSGVSVYLLGGRGDGVDFPSSSAGMPAGDRQGAVLTLSNGESRAVGRQRVPITEADGSRIFTDSARLDYTAAGRDEPEQPIYNRLAVGRGFEYMLTLQDGSKVWMNSESQLEYPVRFTDTVRRVKLSGEAYFEVAHDASRPFLVEVNGRFGVKVLGTRFNIRAYPGDDRAETTLVEGTVAVGGVVLKPSEQAVVRGDRVAAVRQVNVEHCLAWHEGWFYFEDERLEQALEQIGRWYDVRFVFRNGEDGGLKVTGKLKRFENLQVVLDMLTTTTGCRFEMDGRRGYVTK